VQYACCRPRTLPPGYDVEPVSDALAIGNGVGIDTTRSISPESSNQRPSTSSTTASAPVASQLRLGVSPRKSNLWIENGRYASDVLSGYRLDERPSGICVLTDH
jgi:hypothetical protein